MLSAIDPANLNWCAFTVPAQREYLAAYFLRTVVGATTYVPTETRWRRHNRHSRAKDEIAFPVAPRYVWAGFAGEPPWWDISQIPMISGVVGIQGKAALFGGKTFDKFVATIPNGELRVGNGERRVYINGRGVFRAPREQRHMRTHKEFGIGDLVVVTTGPFADMKFKVENIRGKNATVLMPMLLDGGLREVSIPLGVLEGVE